MINQLSSSLKGSFGEWLARLYLCFFGLKHVRSNHRSKSGEIDLIMQHADTLVFIEVKSRSNAYIDDAVYSIHEQKQQRIIHTAKHFLYRHTQWQYHAIRFDVIIVNLSILSITWYRNAFDENGDDT
ncbi:MAG: YraN family protein [Pseudomonadota bacterium]|nr:YraN family protein [Pseudomonadota bacterium]